MQLNGKVIKGIRGIRGFWISLIMLIFGLAFIGFGVYFFVTDSSKKYEEAQATITSRVQEVIGEETVYHIQLKYTDKNGVEHSGVEMDTYDETWTVGKEITIKYNTANPTDVRTSSPVVILPIVLTGLGAVATIVGIVGFISTSKILKRKPNQSSAEEKDETPEENITNEKIYFHLTGKMNQSYVAESKSGKKFYECKLVKFSLFGASTFEFINHETGAKKQLKIGKTISSYSDGGFPLVGDILSSHFKIDGENCWDYVARKGYEIKHLLQGKTIISYEILKKGKVVAKVFPADVRKPFDENSTGYLFMNKGYYRLEIIDAKLSDVVMIAFIVGRTAVVE